MASARVHRTWQIMAAEPEAAEPEAEAAPVLPTARPVNVLAPDDQSSDTRIDRISEEQLLEGLARSIPAEAASGSGSRAKSRGFVMEE